jgi:hypothetical protein
MLHGHLAAAEVIDGEAVLAATRDEAVAASYAGYLKTAPVNPEVVALLTWGITDRYTWLNGEESRTDKIPERPLPFDRDSEAEACLDCGGACRFERSEARLRHPSNPSESTHPPAHPNQSICLRTGSR